MVLVHRFEKKMRIMGALLLLGGASAGCGEMGSPEAPTLEHVSAPLLEGNRVSADPSFPNEQQSETSSVVQGTTGFGFTAYNADDPSHVTYPTTTSRQICKGTSLAGFNIRNTDGTLSSMGRVALPANISVLWGDPAMAYANGSVFMSQLVSPTDRFNVASNNQNCWTNSNGTPAIAMLAGACIFQSTSQTLATNFSSNVVCLRTANDFYDGGSMAGDGNFTVMAAFWNVTQSRVEVWRGPSGGWVHIPSPFPGKTIGGHPLVLGGTTVIAPDGTGNLWISNWHPTNGNWSTPVLVGGTVKDSAPLSNGVVVRSVGYAATLGGPIGAGVPPTAYIAFATPSGSLSRVRVSYCNINPQSGDFVNCFDIPSAATIATANAFLPSIATAHRGVPGSSVFGDTPVRISYWTDEGLNGQARLRSYTLSNPADSAMTAPQTVCPDTRGYWGDYDDMYVANDFTLSPTFVRPYTDSTDAACAMQQYIATPQHVSNWNLPTSDFTPLSLINGWTNAPFSTRNVGIAVIDGMVTFRGAIATASTNSNMAPFVLPSDFRPPSVVYVPVDMFAAAKGRLIIQPNGTVTVQPQGAASTATGFTSLEGVSFPLDTTASAPVTLQGGWVNAPFSTRNAAATNIGGIVHLQGAIGSGTTSTAFTLPVGFRPANNVYVPVDMCGATKGRLLIQANGAVTIGGETSFSNAQCFTSLEGVSFATGTTGFTPLTLLNGWSGAPFGTNVPSVINDKHIVRFQGGMSTSGTNTLAFTLAPELRPPTTTYVPVDLCGGTNGRLIIATTGSVSVQAEKQFSNASCFTSLEGAWFSLW